MSVAEVMSRVDARWWLAPKGEKHRAISAKMARIRDRQQPRRAMYKFFQELYAGQELEGLGRTPYDMSSGEYLPPALPFNVTRNAVETVVARIGKERPLPQVTTDEGDYNLWRRAKRMTKALEGGFEACRVFPRTTRMLRDACVFGTGVAKVWRNDDEPAIDRVFPWELSVDTSEAEHGEPRSIFYEKWYDKSVLIELARGWGCDEETLERIALAGNDDPNGTITLPVDEEDRLDRVLVTECWHLRSSKKAKDGRHCIVITAGTRGGGVDLADEKWKFDYFPFAVLNYKDPICGFWGDSLAQEMSGYQIEINMVGARLRAAHHLAGTGIWLVPDGSGLLEQDFTNDVAPILRHRPGFKPEHVNPDPANPQQYQYLEALRRMAPEDVGLNEMAMSGKKPGGIIAAQALQSIKDETSERMSMPSKAWDQFHCDIGNLLVDIFAEIAEAHGDYTLRAPTARGSRPFAWRDVSLPRDAFNLRTQAASMLAKTPAGRLQQVYDLFNAKVISRVLFMRLLNSPDISAETDIEAAPQVLVDEQLDHMLDAPDPTAAGVYQAPLPFMDLTYAMHRAQCQWALAKMQGAPPETLDLLLDYIAEAKQLLEGGAPPAPATGPGDAPPPALPSPPQLDPTQGGSAPPMPPGVPIQ